MRGEDRNWKELTAKRCPLPRFPSPPPPTPRGTKVQTVRTRSPPTYLPFFLPSFLLPPTPLPLFPNGRKYNHAREDRGLFLDPFFTDGTVSRACRLARETLCYRVSLSPSPIRVASFPTTLENEPLPSILFIPVQRNISPLPVGSKICRFLIFLPAGR